LLRGTALVPGKQFAQRQWNALVEQDIHAG
jgi:hypothetical protein